MSYDEHLISMAGGDGEPMTEIVIENCTTIQPVDLEVIAARQRNCRTYNFGMRDANSLAHHDVPYLLALVREQAAKLEAVKTVVPIQHGLDHDARFANGYNAAIAGIRAAITATEEAS